MTVLPAIFILSTALTVIFSEDGLLENIRVREKIVYFQQQTEVLEDRNSKIRHQIYVLKKLEDRLIQTTASEHYAAPKGATIFRFTD